MTYYLKTIRLKSLALKHRLLANSAAQQKKKAQLHQQNWQEFQHWDLERMYSPTTDGYYYAYGHFASPLDLKSSLVFNEEGVAFSSLKNPFADDINPLYPAYYGLVCYNHFSQTGDATSEAAFWTQVNFLKEYGNWDSDQFILPYEFDFAAYGLKAPWKAGITQALAASLFLRAHGWQGDQGYDLLGQACLAPLLVPKAQGGLSLTTADGHTWIEEFPSPEPSLVLNGFIFCLIAIIEFAKATPAPKYRTYANQLLESLMGRLHHYQYGAYLRHDLMHWNLSNLEYQGLYVFQFIHLYRLTGQTFFHDLALHFEKSFDWKDFTYFYQMEKRTIDVMEYKIQPSR